MRSLQGAFTEQHTIISQNSYGDSPNMGETAHERTAIERFEFVKPAVINKPGDDFVHIIGRANLARDDSIQLVGIIFGQPRLPAHHVGRSLWQSRYNVPKDSSE